MALRLVVLAAALSTVASNELACVSSYDASVDYFPDKVTPTASEMWTIEYFNSYKVINMTAGGSVYSTVAYQCGTPQPTVSYATAYVSVPVDTVAITSTSCIPMIELIGERESLIAYTSSFSYVTSPCLRAMYDAGLSFEAYNANANGGWGARNDTMLERKGVDITFADAWSGTAYNAFVLSPTDETTNLGAAEYLKVYGAMYNQEAAANDVYDEIDARWTCTAANAALYGDAALKVLWVSSYACEWNDDGSTTCGWDLGECPNYYCEYIDEAGGEFIETDITGSVTLWSWYSYLNNSEILSVAAEADVLLYVGGDWNSVVSSEPDTAAALYDIVGGRVYDNKARTGAGSGDDWLESRVANPDAVLEDISSILHSTSHTRVWFRDPYTENTVTMAATCADGYDSTPELLSDDCYSPTAAPTAVPTGVTISGARRTGALAGAASAALLALAGLALAA